MDGDVAGAIDRRPTMQAFEVGIVYKKGNQLFIAVTSTTLVTFKAGKVVEVKPQSPYDNVRSISVDELCEHWGITLDNLDEMTASYLPVPQDSLKTAPRGTRRNRQDADLIWREIRSGRLSKPC